jgi:PAS domain S-box-containing protein
MKACDHPPEALRKEAIALRRRMAEPEATELRPVPPIRRREIPRPDPEAAEAGIGTAEKTRTKRELRRSRDILAEVERLAGVGSWEWDIRADRWTFSENWLRIHGVDRDHLDSEELLRLAHPEDEAAIRAAFRDAVETTGAYDIEHRIRRENDGEVRFIIARGEVERDPDGTPRRMFGAARDITEKVQTETALRRSEMEYRMIVENQADLVVKVDRNGHFLFVSPSYCRLFGKTEVELIGHAFMPLVHEDDRASTAEAMKALFSPPHETFLEQRAMTAKGWRWLAWNDKAILDESGNVSEIVGVGRDVTDRKRAEAERLELERKIKETQKLESLGALAGGIAHDFNNILMVILGNADLAREALPEPSPARENLVEIGTACRRAAELCRQMLAYSGKGRFVVEPLDLSALVSDMGHLLEASVSKKAILRLRPAEALPRMRGDAVQLRQVLVNLVVNASEAIGERSGRITVSTGARECDRAFLDRAHIKNDFPEGTYVFLRVADDGAGMDAETRRRLFEPFFTTKFLGRGLGLSAVSGIVRGHKGTLIFDSAPGEGAEFTILFPALPDSADRART